MPDFGDDRVMACTPDDIVRWVGDMTGQKDVRFVNNEMSLHDRGADITIVVERMPVRRIHLMKFHDTRVQFKYPPEQADQARAWIVAFDKFTQRGGG